MSEFACCTLCFWLIFRQLSCRAYTGALLVDGKTLNASEEEKQNKEKERKNSSILYVISCRMWKMCVAYGVAISIIISTFSENCGARTSQVKLNDILYNLSCLLVAIANGVPFYFLRRHLNECWMVPMRTQLVNLIIFSFKDFMASVWHACEALHFQVPTEQPQHMVPLVSTSSN